MDMANWAIKWGNPLMGAMERRVLNRELKAKIQGLVEALERIHGMAERPACVCGRPTGTAAIKQCAQQALTAYKEGK